MKKPVFSILIVFFSLVFLAVSFQQVSSQGTMTSMMTTMSSSAMSSMMSTMMTTQTMTMMTSSTTTTTMTSAPLTPGVPGYGNLTIVVGLALGIIFVMIMKSRRKPF